MTALSRYCRVRRHYGVVIAEDVLHVCIGCGVLLFVVSPDNGFHPLPFHVVRQVMGVTSFVDFFLLTRHCRWGTLNLPDFLIMALTLLSRLMAHNNSSIVVYGSAHASVLVNVISTKRCHYSRLE